MNPSLPALLDTDILSALMRRQPPAVAHARRYLVEHQHLAFSVITRYEVLRGLLAKSAHRQRSAFDRLCAASDVLPLTDPIVDRAAEIYADLHRRGELIGDADILIAATALVQDRILVTNNVAHHRRVPGLQIANWLTDPPLQDAP
jgi:tRNA(fMet)-specific endonuclease VapC